MQLFDKTLFIEFYSRHCRRYQKLVLTLIGAICIMLAMFSGNQLAQGKKESNKKVLMVKLPNLVLNPTHELSQDKQAVTIAKIDTQEPTTVPLTPIPPLASVVAKQAKDIYKKVTVKNGDTLAKIFSSVGISSAELQNILKSDKTSKQLISIKPGQTLSFMFDQNKSLQEITLPIDYQKTLSIKKTNSNYKFNLTEKPVEKRLAFSSNHINGSLYKSAISAGLDSKLIGQMAEIFAWDIDFALDIRPGDKFKVLYQIKYVEDKKIDSDKIIAAEFVNKGKTYHAVYYKDSKGQKRYYNPKGYGLQKAFLRSPVKFTRISSQFDLGRRHPILHIVRAHRGVDLAAAVGTPVKAAGDGKVIFVGKKNGYGNVIILQHGSTYSTVYGHLSKFANQLRNGQHVNQGQVIGYVGSTGHATGPHLHYEFRINGVHQNPLTVSLPQTLEIPSREKKNFLNHANKMLQLLEQHTKTSPLTKADTNKRT